VCQCHAFDKVEESGYAFLKAFCLTISLRS
jgi:hypothetical protein